MPETGTRIEPVEVPVSALPEVPLEPPDPTRPGGGTVALPPAPEVAIVLSGRQPAFEAVALELSKQLDRLSIYDLSDRSQPADAAFGLINDSDAGAVVAIGLPAARAAVALSSKPIVFSQVFNYRAHGLVTESSRGVAALPPLSAHLSAWTDAAPSLRHIGAIIGQGHEELAEEARVAAEERGMRLTLVTVGSDQEAFYAFRRLVPEIDGFWLFPDNRIMSSRSLREMLALANRREVSVAVSNEAMLELGASISISAVAENVASTIVDVLRRIEAGQIAQVPDLTPLSATRVVSH